MEADFHFSGNGVILRVGWCRGDPVWVWCRRISSEMRVTAELLVSAESQWGEQARGSWLSVCTRKELFHKHCIHPCSGGFHTFLLDASLVLAVNLRCYRKPCVAGLGPSEPGMQLHHEIHFIHNAESLCLKVSCLNVSEAEHLWRFGIHEWAETQQIPTLCTCCG